MVEDKLSHHHYAFRRQSVQLRQPVSESIQGVTGTLSDLVASGDDIEPLPHHHINRGLQALKNIVQVHRNPRSLHRPSGLRGAA